MKYLIANVKRVVVLTTFLLSIPVLAQDFAPLRIKGLWVVRESMVSKAEVDAALNFAKKGGFNHVFVQVRGRGDAYYNSLIVPRSPRIREGRFDPLAYAVKRGHELGLNIHAWVTTYLLWSARRPPQTNSHIYFMHPEWLEIDAAGNMQKDIDLSAPRDENFEGIYLSPTHPDVNGYLQAVFAEIILNYNIDGLHLDYSRFFDLDFGYNEAGVNAFTQEYGFDPRKISTTARPNANGTRSNMDMWSDYRRAKVTDLIVALHALITISGKEIYLTSAVKPNIRLARNKYFQDWSYWLKAGLIDYALPMNYTVERSIYLDNISIIADALPEQYRRQVIMGVAVYNQSAAETAEKIKLARMFGFRDICVFSYDAHKTNLPHFDPIIEMMNR